MRFRPRLKPWRGLIADAAGGLAASFLMGPVHALAQKAGRPKKKREEDPTEKVAAAVSENVLDHTLTRREKKAAAPVVRYMRRSPGLWDRVGRIEARHAQQSPTLTGGAQHGG